MIGRMLTSPAMIGDYVPFLTPMNFVQDWWFLLAIPLALTISGAYKAVRTRDLRNYPREVLVMTGQILLGMIALSIALHLLVEVLIPLLPAE